VNWVSDSVDAASVVLESPPLVPESRKGLPCRSVVDAGVPVAKDEDEADMVLDAAEVFRLDDCPNLKIGLNTRVVGRTGSTCIFASIVVPQKTFVFGVPPAVPKPAIADPLNPDINGLKPIVWVFETLP